MLEGLKHFFSLSFIWSSSGNDQKGSVADQKVKDLAPTSFATKSESSGKAITALPIKTEPEIDKIDFPTTLEEKKKLCEQFKVGDVVATHLTGLKKVEKVDPIIVILQRIAKFFGRSSPEADSSVVHISIVVGIDEDNGRVLIAEAIPSRKGGLRTVDLFYDHSCVLEKGMGYKYQILRPTTSYVDTAQKAAQIAERYSPKSSSYRKQLGLELEDSIPEKDKAKSKFSFILALKGMFKRFDNFNTKSKRRVFKGIFDEHAQTTTLTAGSRPRKIFCSAFGAHLFQRTEAQKAWKILCARHAELQGKLDDLTEAVGKNHPNAEKQVSQWAKEMEEQYGKELEQEMKQFKINYKVTVPQDFVYYFKKENILEPAFDLVPPAA